MHRLDEGDVEKLALDLERARIQAREAARRRLWALQRAQAAFLARDLQPGEPCLVCGSESHPAPALVGEDEEAARLELEAADERVAALEARLAQVTRH